MIEVRLDGGKYAVVLDGDGAIHYRRYGEFWYVPEVGTKLLIAWVHEHEHLRQSLADAKSQLAMQASELAALRARLVEPMPEGEPEHEQATRARYAAKPIRKDYWGTVSVDSVLPAAGCQTCPKCGAYEVKSESPFTRYACGSSDYDQRPETFVGVCVARAT